MQIAMAAEALNQITTSFKITDTGSGCDHAHGSRHCGSAWPGTGHIHRHPGLHRNIHTRDLKFIFDVPYESTVNSTNKI